MTMSEIPERLLPFGDTPAKALSVSTRLALSKHLNPEVDMLSQDRSLVMDWRGMAEFFEFSPLDIDNFNRERNPTIELVKQWAFRDGSTLRVLLEALEAIERFDVLNDEQLISSFERDSLAHQKSVESQRVEQAGEEVQPIQVDEVSSQDEFKNITINEAATGVPEFFDAFVCYTGEDFAFVQQMIHRLETVHGLKLCIVSRDLIPGCAQYVIMAKLIEERCRKMVIVLSPDYIESKECEFQTRFAHSLAPGAKEKKLIPVIYRSCKVPAILNHICTVDYTRCDVVEWFWVRLANSLKNTRSDRSLIPSTRIRTTTSTSSSTLPPTTDHSLPPRTERNSDRGGASQFVISPNTSNTELQHLGRHQRKPTTSEVLVPKCGNDLSRTSSKNSLTETGSNTSWTDLREQEMETSIDLNTIQSVEPETRTGNSANRLKPLRKFFDRLRHH